jgi:hypothetical protein
MRQVFLILIEPSAKVVPAPTGRPKLAQGIALGLLSEAEEPCKVDLNLLRLVRPYRA